MCIPSVKLFVGFIHTEGDILDAMANAVQDSDVILMCMSEQYRDSRSCRSGTCMFHERLSVVDQVRVCFMRGFQ